MTLVGVSLKNKCVSYCKRRLCVCVCVCVCVYVGRDLEGISGSVRVRDCLYSLPARVSFEMQQAGFTIIGTKFIETSEREH